MDESIALVEFSKHCVETVAYAHIEVGLKIWFPRRHDVETAPDAGTVLTLADIDEHHPRDRRSRSFTPPPASASPTTPDDGSTPPAF